MITAKHLELRKRRGLMVVAVLLTVGLPVLVLGIRLLFHAFDPASYGPAGSPGVFQALCQPMAEFGFIIAATLGASVATTDLTDGMFRHLVVTGRSRVALYLARIPAGLAVILPLVAVAFAALCLVTSYAGTPQPTSVGVNGISFPACSARRSCRAWLARTSARVRSGLRQRRPSDGPGHRQHTALTFRQPPVGDRPRHDHHLR